MKIIENPGDAVFVSPAGERIELRIGESERRKSRIRVSTDGGDKPRWRRDGTELYYIAADGRLVAVPVRRTPTFGVGVPVALVEVRVPKGSFFPYDVAHDGRFLVDTLSRSTDPTAGMTVVLNWMVR